MNTYINHKTGDTIETEMTEAEALKKLPQTNSFAMNLKKKYEETDGALSESQLFWIMKLAVEAADIFEYDTTEILGGEAFRVPERIFGSEILEILQKGKIKIKGLAFNSEILDITIYPNGVIWMNGSSIGRYLPNGLSMNGDIDKKIVHDIFLYFAKNPVRSFDEIGRRTGVCCYCGITLTHEISIGLGRGPVCSDKYGLPFPHAEYEKSLRKQRENARTN